MSEPAVPVLAERSGAVAIVTLNRPARRNGVTLGMCIALYETLREIAASDARVLLLRGAGNDFCVGADIGGDSRKGGARGERTDFYHASTLLHTMPQVTIAAIDGGCAGAGMGWAAACDLRWASTRARFSTAFLGVGASGDMGLAWFLDRIVGPARAREWLFFPVKTDAAAALDAGFVTRLFAPEALHAHTLQLATALGSRDAGALRAMKANSLDAAILPLADYIDAETVRHLAITSSPGFATRMKENWARAKAARQSD